MLFPHLKDLYAALSKPGMQQVYYNGIPQRYTRLEAARAIP